jgi:hypothetical protein
VRPLVLEDNEVDGNVANHPKHYHSFTGVSGLYRNVLCPRANLLNKIVKIVFGLFRRIVGLNIMRVNNDVDVIVGTSLGANTAGKSTVGMSGKFRLKPLAELEGVFR